MQSQELRTADQQEFEARLGALVRAAERAGVDLQRVNDVAANGSGHWEISINRVESAPGDEALLD